MKIILPLTLILTLFIAGCANYGKLTSNLKDDPAIVVLNVGTPWGVQKVVRIGGTTNSVTVTPEGSVTVNPPAPSTPPTPTKTSKK